MNICEAIIKNLELIGVDAAFGGSGSGDADILFALADSKQIDTIIVRHEQAASFMACGYAMFSDKLGVCFATPGPGAFNLISGLSVAYSDSIPVLAITGYETAQGVGKGGLGETTGLNRTPDSQKVFEAITKKTYLIEKPEQTCDILEDAVNTAYEGRPGPVHIHIPFDISKTEVPNYRDIVFKIVSPAPDQELVKQYADEIEKGILEKRKIIAILGYGCMRSHAEKDCIDFLENYQIPFMTTMDAKGMLPENHPLCLGMTGASGDPGAKKALKDAEVVLALGNSFSKWQTWRWAEGIYDKKTLLQINIDKQAKDRVYKADVFLLSDIKPAIAGIAKELENRDIHVKKADVQKEKHINADIEYTGNKIHPAALSREISALIPQNAIILGDAGSHMLWLASNMELNNGQNYQNPGIFGPMAANVNAAIGVQKGAPHRKVIVGCGDGDYQMAGFELMTAVENKIPVIWIIFNNGEYNIIKMMHKKNYNGKEVFNHFLNPDYLAYAQACGAKGYRIEELKDFAPAFKEALEQEGPCLIDVQVESEVYAPFGLF
ncbi:MAG: thiamine pyrophosphate-binding protein [Spirochaetia bacterium]